MVNQPLVTHRVARIGCVLSAIDFNDKALLSANEVDGEWSDGFLTDKLLAEERTRAEAIP
jgi:hypothetical protein